MFGRGGGVTFQLLMLSPNLLKSQIPYARWDEGMGGGGVVFDHVRHLVIIWGELQNFDKIFFSLAQTDCITDSLLQRLITSMNLLSIDSTHQYL